MGRSCSFFECKATTGLHAFPKDRERIVLWLRAMGRSVTSTTNTTGMFACNRHFNPESYENYGRLQMGFITQSQLRLKEDAVPNPTYFHYFVLPPSNPPKACQDMGCQTEVTTKEVGCQTSPSTRDIGFQHHKKPERRSKTTQVILRVKEKASSTDPAITLVQVLPLDASTPISTPASTSDLSSLASPAKRPRTEDDPDYRLDETGSSAYNERFSRMDSIATVDSCIQGKPQQFGSGHPSSDAAITEIIGFSDEESVSSDAENSRPPDEEIDSSDEGGGGGAEGTPDHSSDSDWTPGDETVGSENEEKENDSSVEGGGGKRLGGDEEEEGEHSSDWDGGPLDHRSINSTSVRRERPPQQQTVPWGDTHSFSDSGENFDKGGRRLRKLCPECGMLFRALKPHACEHKIKPCFCNLCGKRFATEQALRIHNRIHQESYKYVCRFCLATFKTRPDKVKHESSHPRRALKPYRCSECPETFVTFLERREHMKRSHRAPRADPVVFVCHTCDMRFRCKHKLQRHSVVHTGEKQYVCKVCERSFNQSGHLRSHMRVHTGEKPYQCQHCDKSFNHNVSLKSHIQRYHDGQAPDPGMEGQTKKTNRKESTAELDDTTEMENSGLNEEEEAKRNNDTLCNSEEKEDEAQGVAKKQNTGKANSGSRRAVNTSHDQLKRKSCDGDEPEEGRGNNSGSASDSADEGEKRRGSKRMRKTSWRSKGRPRRNSEGEEHSSHSEVDLESENSSDSDFDPTRGNPKKIGKAPQTRKDRRRHRGRSKNNPLV